MTSVKVVGLVLMLAMAGSDTAQPVSAYFLDQMKITRIDATR